MVEKDQLEEALLRAYEGTLTQSNTTPCMQSPLVERLGLCSTTDTAQSIVMGEDYNDEGVNEDTKEEKTHKPKQEQVRKDLNTWREKLTNLLKIKDAGLLDMDGHTKVKDLKTKIAKSETIL